MKFLAVTLDQESYEWLAGHHPDILDAIEKEVAAGRNARDIKHFVMIHTLRAELAQRCFQAARHIERENNK